MARFSLSVLVLCLFMALMASAMPIKRDDVANQADYAMKEIEAAAQRMKEMVEKYKEAQEANDKNTSDNSNQPATTDQAENKNTPMDESTTPTSTSPTESTPVASTAAQPPKASNTHIVNNNPLSKVPLIGGLLSGGGLQSL
ncbi:uncharacterized protein BO97DRAFT_136587 [Aspergillus homomorphus CBS 101889]|uniref:Uncharacterized protein n=1 Tax=Aspergillus homomorphus (strain CBS 101889) TaxID=1450537 RepID=A0A395I8N5_ASPHC|nr:hypothetical protein BO97DRAFT_136587 [Aspergillus homomorphus CBS 101889]RAL16517.1 hypothetical protein BO97DRAFT_136587 [Aspergillus homomorphus CBS 101889]